MGRAIIIEKAGTRTSSSVVAAAASAPSKDEHRRQHPPQTNPKPAPHSPSSSQECFADNRAGPKTVAASKEMQDRRASLAPPPAVPAHRGPSAVSNYEPENCRRTRPCTVCPCAENRHRESPRRCSKGWTQTVAERGKPTDCELEPCHVPALVRNASSRRANAQIELFSDARDWYSHASRIASSPNCGPTHPRSFACIFNPISRVFERRLRRLDSSAMDRPRRSFDVSARAPGFAGRTGSALQKKACIGSSHRSAMGSHRIGRQSSLRGACAPLAARVLPTYKGRGGDRPTSWPQRGCPPP